MAATLISGDRSGAYRYLPCSVVLFLDAEQMCARLRHAGFGWVTATPLTMGIVTVYVATREWRWPGKTQVKTPSPRLHYNPVPTARKVR